jgi:hypothetical protein
MSLKMYLIVYKNGTHEFIPADWASIREGEDRICFGNGGYGTEAVPLPFAWQGFDAVLTVREVTGWNAEQVEFVLSRFRPAPVRAAVPDKAPLPMMDGEALGQDTAGAVE